MMDLAGIQEGRVDPSPPPPQGQPRVRRPKRDWRLELRPEDWQEGPTGLMSSGDMLVQAGYVVAREEVVEAPPLPPGPILEDN
eukprot:4493011-Karenia_brevis.AAC.1